MLMRLYLLLITCFFFAAIILPQAENVPSDHPVYSFLKKMHVEGILRNYNDVILPLSKQKIINALTEIENSANQLSKADAEFLMRMKEKFYLDDHFENLSENFPASFTNIFNDEQKNIYRYNDSAVSFFVNPVFDYNFIHSNLYSGSASLLNFGGKIYGSYEDWFGFYLQGSNGLQFGNREAARLDPRIEQSYTFNHTGIDFFDGTKGYMRFQKGLLAFQLGRERITWGTGYINKLILSENPPLFDFIKLDLSYKSLSYNFIHGWLVQKPNIFYIDDRVGHVKEKIPKYFAISRLGFAPSDNISFGISQLIVYSNRPFEAAYLNPFLFWESAQRSMNDLDNSMLSFDGRYLITNGLEINASIIFDDLDFSNLSEGSWVDNTNGSAWQAGMYLTSPLLPKNLELKIEYLQLRPYMFSHPGIGEALTYTNNGYLLGTDVQPNSTLFSAELDYRFSGKLNFSLRYDHLLHGSNIYDEEGNLVKNFGGNVFNNLSMIDSQRAYLLDGIRERSDKVSLNINYEVTYGLYFNLSYSYSDFNFVDNKNHENQFWCSFKIDFE